MTLSEAFRLAHQEVVTHRARSIATVVVIGVLFGALLGALLVARGLENAVLEVLGDKIAVVEYFKRWNRDLVYPVSAVLVIISAFVLAMTMAHIIMNNARIFALYKSVGASKWQVMLICFAYILEISAPAALFAVGLALILAGVATAVGWDYLTAQLKGLYPEAPEFAPILLGVDWRAGVVLLAIFLTSPVAMLLCLDQFSDKKIAKRLKEE